MYKRSVPPSSRGDNGKRERFKKNLSPELARKY